MYGLTWRPRQRSLAWIENFFVSGCQVLPITEPIARAAGQLRGRLAAEGRMRTQADQACPA